MAHFNFAKVLNLHPICIWHFFKTKKLLPSSSTYFRNVYSIRNEYRIDINKFQISSHIEVNAYKWYTHKRTQTHPLTSLAPCVCVYFLMPDTFSGNFPHDGRTTSLFHTIIFTMTNPIDYGAKYLESMTSRATERIENKTNKIQNKLLNRKK